MSEKYVIELDDKKIMIEGQSYYKISGTSILVHSEDIKNLTPAESKGEEKKSIKDIECGDRYFFINDCGGINLGIWENVSVDKFRKDSGNVFLIKEEAEFEKKRIEIIGIIRKYAEPLNTPWDCENLHFFLVAQLDRVNRVGIDCNWERKREGFYFATQEDAQRAIAEAGEANLLKYYFMVED